MSWSWIQSASGNALGAASATFGTNLSSGTKLIAAATSFQVVTTAVKDTAGNSFTKLASIRVATSNSELSLWALDTPAGDVGGTTTVTLTNGGAISSVVVQEVSGLLAGNTSAMLDGTAGTNSGTAGTSATTGAYSSTAANEYLVFVGGDDENTTAGTWTGTPTGSTTYTDDPHNQNSTTHENTVIAYGNSVSGAESGTWTISSMTGNNWGTILVAFKLASGGPVLSGPSYTASMSSM